jgi:membrane fusion protein, multidrug efflux system
MPLVTNCTRFIRARSDSMRAMKTLPRSIALVLLSTALLASLTGCGGANAVAAKPDAARAPVEVATVVRGPIEAHYLATAPLISEREAQIVSETAGSVLRLLVEEGDRVNKGQALAQLDVERATLDVARARAQVSRLQNDHQRLERLSERHLVSREMRDQSRFELQTQRAALALAQLQVDKATIRAPFAGVITARHLKVGQVLSANAHAFEIGDFSELTAVLNVPERQAQALKEGQPVQVHFDAFANQSFVGEIKRLSPVIDSSSGTLAATVMVRDRDGQLRPGLFARINVLLERRENVLQIPKAALISTATVPTLWIVDGDQARRRPVVTGLDQAGMVEVREGLTPDARVIVQGQESLSDGSRVQVLNVNPAPSVAGR